MKRVLIVSHGMELGGAESALLGLLEHVDTSRVSVDLFLLRHSGELMPYIPDGIRLLPEKTAYACLGVPMAVPIKKGRFLIAGARFWGRMAAKRTLRALKPGKETDIELINSHRYTSPLMPKISEERYDAVISFLTPHYFAARHVVADRRIAWIHTDYATVGVDAPTQVKMWDAYDAIVSISHSVTQSFVSTFPQLAGKVVEIENMLPTAYIRQKSENAVAPGDFGRGETVRLLSVGRFCNAKNFDNVPYVMAELTQMGIDARWYLIGYGPLEGLIRQRIAEAGMDDRVIMLGKRDNPYPYIAACDLYVQPSRFEGKSVTVREAQLLGRPVAITRYPTSANQLEENVDGAIIPLDNHGMAKGLYDLINEPEKLSRMAEVCRSRDYANSEMTERFYELIGL